MAIETLKIYDEMDMAAMSEGRRDLQAQLRSRFADHPLVGEVRGVGLVGAVELVEDKATRKNFDPAQKVGIAADQARRAERRHHARDDQ